MSKKKPKKNRDGAAPFATIDCIRCGSQRILENPCPECGALPRSGEVNHQVVVRREASRIVEAAEQSLCPAAQGTFVEALTGFADTITEASIRIIEKSSSKEELEESGHTIGAFRTFVLEVSERGTLRPNTLEKAVGKTGTELLEVWELTKQALTTSSIDEAQRLRGRAQTQLDNAHRAISSVAVTAAAADVLVADADGVPLTRRAMHALSIANPHLSGFPELTKHGIEAVSTVVGNKVSPGSGLSFLLLSIIGQHMLDWDRMKQKIQEATQIVSNPDRLREIAAMDGSTVHLGELNRLNFEALDAYAKSVTHVDDPTTILRRLAKATAEVYENAISLLAWYRLMGSPESGAGHYLKNEQKDATDHVTTLARLHPSALFEDMPSHMRNAGSHGRTIEIDAAEETVTFSLRSHEETITYDQFIDRCLGVIESVLASYWALEAALRNCDIDIPIDENDAQYLGIGPLESAAAFLEMRQMGEVSTQRSTPYDWVIEAPLAEEESIVMALTLANTRDNKVQSITVRSTNVDDELITIPYGAYVTYEKAPRGSGPEEAIALLDYLSACSATNGPALTENNLQWVTRCFAMTLQPNDAGAIPLIRRLRAHAKRMGMKETEAHATEIIRALRTETIDTARKQFGNLPQGTEPELPSPHNLTLML